jgi:hypothetical protein
MGPRPGHQHWHFTGFATYRLVDSNHHVVAGTAKEAFCLSNTDAIDYTLPAANWQPDTTNLNQQSCGDSTSQTLRQRLDIGSGDTYTADLPGQSLPITNLPNGTYHIQITVNPDQRLHESDTTNNTSLRQVVIGGTPGARTVDVPPYQTVNS